MTFRIFHSPLNSKCCLPTLERGVYQDSCLCRIVKIGFSSGKALGKFPIKSHSLENSRNLIGYRSEVYSVGLRLESKAFGSTVRKRAKNLRQKCRYRPPRIVIRAISVLNLKAGLHRRFLSQRLSAIFVAPKLQPAAISLRF